MLQKVLGGGGYFFSDSHCRFQELRPFLWLALLSTSTCCGGSSLWQTRILFVSNFLLRMRRNGHKTTSGQIFNPKFEIPMGCFLFGRILAALPPRFICVLHEKLLL